MTSKVAPLGVDDLPFIHAHNQRTARTRRCRNGLTGRHKYDDIIVQSTEFFSRRDGQDKIRFRMIDTDTLVDLCAPLFRDIFGEDCSPRTRFDNPYLDQVQCQSDTADLTVYT